MVPPDTSNPDDWSGPNEALRKEARRWIVRQDRGLSAGEQASFMQWLNADPKNLRAFQRSMAAWKMLDRMPASTAGLPRSTAARSIWKWGSAVGAAAAVMALLYFGEFRPGFLRAPAVPFPAASGSPCALHLSDGTTVYLNSGSEVVERFTPAERHVLLLRGEANFEVAKNPGRPFVVRAGSVEVRDVGTVFNVCLKPAAVEVMVSEGQVRVGVAPSAKTAPPSGPAPGSSWLYRGQEAVVDLSSRDMAAAIKILAINPSEAARVLAWKQSLLRLGGATLAELAAKFERRTGRRIIFLESGLADIRIGGQFRSDDLDGFVRVLRDYYGLESEWKPDGEIALRKAR